VRLDGGTGRVPTNSEGEVTKLPRKVLATATAERADNDGLDAICDWNALAGATAYLTTIVGEVATFACDALSTASVDRDDSEGLVATFCCTALAILIVPAAAIVGCVVSFA